MSLLLWFSPMKLFSKPGQVLNVLDCSKNELQKLKVHLKMEK